MSKRRWIAYLEAEGEWEGEDPADGWTAAQLEQLLSDVVPTVVDWEIEQP